MEKELSQILVHVRKKQLLLGNIFRITKNMEECFNNNDVEGAELALDLRMEEILNAQDCDEEIEKIFDTMDTADALHLTQIMKLLVKDMELTEEERILYELYRNIKSTVDKIIEIDSNLSRRIGGESSMYNKKIEDMK